jgi:hypothetical protein
MSCSSLARWAALSTGGMSFSWSASNAAEVAMCTVGFRHLPRLELGCVSSTTRSMDTLLARALRNSSSMSAGSLS